jgi:transposase
MATPGARIQERLVTWYRLSRGEPDASALKAMNDAGMGDSAQRTERGTSLEQRRALIAAYRRTGKMAQAMREAGIRSPRTAYLWWRRYEAEGDAGLVPRSRARKTQRTVPEALAEEALALKQAHPAWGRRRIARELQARHGPRAISPAGVEAVLRRGRLWTPAPRRAAPDREPPALLLPAGNAELDALLPVIVAGLEAGFHSRSAESVDLLGRRVWRRLGADRRVWPRLLDDPSVGPLLLRSRVELGRGLMNTGRWRAAADILAETLGWLRQATPRRGDADPSDPGHRFSLRRHDAWIETYQYLGIVLRDRDRDIARSFLNVALADVRSRSRRLIPTDRPLAEGNLERDIARLLLRGDTAADAEIDHHLAASRAALEEAGDLAMLAATEMSWADLYARRAGRARHESPAAWIAELDLMEASLARALETIETFDSPLLYATFAIDASRLAAAHGLPADARRLRTAAHHSLTFGYGGQAQEILGLPNAADILAPDVLRALAAVVRGLEEPVPERVSRGDGR